MTECTVMEPMAVPHHAETRCGAQAVAKRPDGRALCAKHAMALVSRNPKLVSWDIPGYVNAGAFNREPDGDMVLFLTREDRDAALDRFRDHAVRRGLSASASRSSIYPVSVKASRIVAILVDIVEADRHEGYRVESLS